MNAGKLDTTAEVRMETHDMACLEEVCAPDHIRTLTKSFGTALDIVGLMPFTSGHLANIPQTDAREVELSRR